MGANATQAQCNLVGTFSPVVSATNTAATIATNAAQYGAQNANPQVYNAGMQLDYGPFEFGADYEQSYGTGSFTTGAGQAVAFNAAGAATAFAAKTNEMISNQIDLNLSYTIGAVRLGAEWSRGYLEGITGDANVKRAAINDEIQVGGSYTVGPGVALVGFVQEALYDANGKYVPLASGAQNIYAKDSNSTALIFETSLRF